MLNYSAVDVRSRNVNIAFFQRAVAIRKFFASLGDEIHPIYIAKGRGYCFGCDETIFCITKYSKERKKVLVQISTVNIPQPAVETSI